MMMMTTSEGMTAATATARDDAIARAEKDTVTNQSNSDFTTTTNITAAMNGNARGRSTAVAATAAEATGKTTTTNVDNNNNNNNNNADSKFEQQQQQRNQQLSPNSKLRESGRIKLAHVQRATLDAEAKARNLKFTSSMFPRANIRVKYLGMVDDKIAEKMDVEKLVRVHRDASIHVPKSEMLKPLGYKCEGLLFSEPFEARIDENGNHFVRWGAEGEGRRVVETPSTTAIMRDDDDENKQQHSGGSGSSHANEADEYRNDNNNNNNNNEMLDVDASVKCIVNEIARRFDNQIPGMKPSRSSSLKLNTSKFDHKSGSSDGRLCSNCGAGSSSTPLMRRGPDGVRSLCNACGLWYARRGTQRPIEGGSVAEREAEKAAIALKLNQGKPSSAAGNNTNNFAHGEQAEAGKEENDEEHKRKDEKTAEEKERLARIVPKIETLSGLAVFGYHEHVVQEALRAHVIAKYAPLLGIDLLTSTGLHKYGRYESSSGKTEQRRSSKRERKEISKFVDEAAFTANKAPQKRKNAATGISKAAATKK
jgi:hypothetical protein